VLVEIAISSGCGCGSLKLSTGSGCHDGLPEGLTQFNLALFLPVCCY